MTAANPHTALIAAGYRMGRRPSPGGRCNDPAPGVPGFVLDTGWNDDAGTRCTMVDHYGPGREAAMAAYAAALTAAGVITRLVPRRRLASKTVLRWEREVQA